MQPEKTGVDRLKRGAAEIIPEAEFDAKLKSGKQLRVKLGIDPTAPDIHLGHSVVLRKLRHFQEAGHKVVLIIGDYTARIGDPTGRSETRKVATSEEIASNTKTYLSQIGKIFDTADDRRFELRYNSEWLKPLSFEKVLELAHTYTVAQLLARKDFAERFRAGEPLGLHELFYPMMQGYDSVVIDADVELGGTDQKFNILVGRELQRIYGNPSPQVVFLMPILEGTDGVQKMSKSLGNYIGVTDLPEEMFGKAMSIPDALMPSWYRLLTDLPGKELELLDRGEGNPRDWKARLGEWIVECYYGKEAARKAAENFGRPNEIPEFVIPVELLGEHGVVAIGKLLVAANLAPSMREAKRLLSQGALQIDGKPVSDERLEIKIDDGMVLQAGKRRFVRLRTG